MAPRKSKPAAAQKTATKPAATKEAATKEAATLKTTPAVSAPTPNPVAQQPPAQLGAAPVTPPAKGPATLETKADPPAVSDQVTGVVMSPLRHDGMAFAIGDPIALEALVFAGLEKAGVVKPA